MKYCINLISIAVTCGLWFIGGSAYATTVVLPNCNVSVDFFADAKKKPTEVEQGVNIDVFTATHGQNTQSAWCAPGTAKNAAEMRELMSFVADSKKLRNVRSSVANSPIGWLFFAEADSTASDGATSTRFEYQCRSISITKHVVCLVASGRQSSFPREAADQFFESLRSYSDTREPATRNSNSPSLPPANPKKAADENVMNLIYEGLDRKAKALGRNQPWGSCINPIFSKLQNGLDAEREIIGISKLTERKTSLGKIYALLVKRKNSSENNIFECELSAEREYISGRVIR